MREQVLTDYESILALCGVGAVKSLRQFAKQIEDEKWLERNNGELLEAARNASKDSALTVAFLNGLSSPGIDKKSLTPEVLRKKATGSPNFKATTAMQTQNSNYKFVASLVKCSVQTCMDILCCCVRGTDSEGLDI